MKTLVLSMITIAATLAAMTACTSDSDPLTELTKDAKVEIKLKTGVINVTTKADDPTASNDKTKFADNTSIQLLRWDAATKPVTLDWKNVKQVAATAGANEITFGETQYYPTDGSHTYFMGLYPAIDGTNVVLDNTGKVTFKGLDGKTDILNAPLIDAGDKSNTAAKNIQFNHVLSKININLKGDKAAQTYFGDIKKITITGAPSDISLTLGATTPTVELGSTPKNIDVMSSTEGVSLSTQGINYSVMLPPSLGKEEADKIVIQIETTIYDSTNPLIVDVADINGGTQSGVANSVNLTFKDKITVETGITDWTNNETGSNHEIENK